MEDQSLDELIVVDLQIAPEFSGRVAAERLTEAARITLADEGRHQVEICVVLTSDEEVKELNRTYRGLDEPTDVLSFSVQEGQGSFVVGDPKAGVYLGDIVIAYPYARRQAVTQGHDIDMELNLLVIHGVLHLLGYDHTEAEEEVRMWDRQRQLLSLLSV